MSLEARLQAKLNIAIAEAVDGGTRQADLAAALSKTFSSTGSAGAAGYASKCFSDTRTLTASSSESLDLAGSLVDALGNTVSFSKIRAILVMAASGNANQVIVGNGTNPFIGPFGAAGASVIHVDPGGYFLAVKDDAAGWTVTASTGDVLKVANSGGGTSVTYTIFILGE